LLRVIVLGNPVVEIPLVVWILYSPEVLKSVLK